MARGAGLICGAALLLASGGGPARGQETAPFVFETAVTGSSDRALRWPVGVASASPDEIVVAEAFDPPRLVVFRRIEGGWKDERAVPLPAVPVAIAAAGERYVVALRGQEGLATLERRGFTLGRLGLPRGSEPRALAAAPDGGLLVLDAAGGQVLVLSAAGGVLRRAPAPAGTRALLAAPDGGFHAAVPAQGVVLRCTPDGATRQTLALPREGPVPAWPQALAAGGGGRLVVLDRHAGRLWLLDASGAPLGSAARSGRDPGQLLFPSALAALDDGRMAVADQGNGRLQIVRRAAAERTP
jgi:DNA-binding beta-propeller fold protein YncE